MMLLLPYTLIYSKTGTSLNWLVILEDWMIYEDIHSSLWNVKISWGKKAKPHGPYRGITWVASPLHSFPWAEVGLLLTDSCHPIDPLSALFHGWKKACALRSRVQASHSRPGGPSSPPSSQRALPFFLVLGGLQCPTCSPTTSPSSHRALPSSWCWTSGWLCPTSGWAIHSPGRSSALGPSSPPVSP